MLTSRAAPPTPTSTNTNKARNERQKALLLDEVAAGYKKAAAELCAHSRFLIAQSKARCIRFYKLLGG